MACGQGWSSPQKITEKVLDRWGSLDASDWIPMRRSWWAWTTALRCFGSSKSLISWPFLLIPSWTLGQLISEYQKISESCRRFRWCLLRLWSTRASNTCQEYSWETDKDFGYYQKWPWWDKDDVISSAVKEFHKNRYHMHDGYDNRRLRGVDRELFDMDKGSIAWLYHKLHRCWA